MSRPVHLYVAAALLVVQAGFALVIGWQLLAGWLGPGSTG